MSIEVRETHTKEIIPAEPGETVDIGGHKVKVSGYIRVTDGGKVVGHLPCIEMQSDYEWQCMALAARLAHPEYYADMEDTPAVIEQLRRWIAEYEEKYPLPSCRAGEELGEEGAVHGVL